MGGVKIGGGSFKKKRGSKVVKRCDERDTKDALFLPAAKPTRQKIQRYVLLLLLLLVETKFILVHPNKKNPFETPVFTPQDVGQSLFLFLVVLGSEVCVCAAKSDCGTERPRVLPPSLLQKCVASQKQKKSIFTTIIVRSLPVMQRFLCTVKIKVYHYAQ